MDEQVTVLVGVDGSDTGRQVVRYALAEGLRRSAVVRVLRVLRPPRWFEAGHAKADPVSLVLPPPSPEAVRADLREECTRLVDEVRAESAAFDGVPVTVEVLAGHPAQVLVEEARHADVLVVGHRGHPLATGLGSVALACVLRAPVPVTVVQAVDTPSPAAVAAGPN